MTNCIDGVMVSAVDRGFKPWSGQTKDYKIGICCFFARHTAVKKKGVRAKTGWLGIGIMCQQVERHVYTWTVVSVS
jgi:hypothetical protein